MEEDKEGHKEDRLGMALVKTTRVNTAVHAVGLKKPGENRWIFAKGVAARPASNLSLAVYAVQSAISHSV